MMGLIRMYTTFFTFKIIITILTITPMLLILAINLKEKNIGGIGLTFLSTIAYILILSIILTTQGYFTKYRENFIEKNEEEFLLGIESNTNKLLEKEQHGNNREKN